MARRPLLLWCYPLDILHGQPWLSQGRDTYTETELNSLAAGVGRSVAGRLNAPPPEPHCPGSPGC